MEYVILRATHPSHLTLQLPKDVAEITGYRRAASDASREHRSVSFLSRGPGILRVVATYAVREGLAIETVRDRLVASARPNKGLLFTLPAAVATYLRLSMTSGGGPTRRTDDSVLWLAPAPEYYAFRQSAQKGTGVPTADGASLGHVYLVKSTVPLPRELLRLAELEERIEREEWGPGIEVLQRVARRAT